MKPVAEKKKNQPVFTPYVCDVCGRVRMRYSHEKCSKIRKARGFPP